MDTTPKELAKRLQCIFCDFRGDTLAELKEHSAECKLHPLKKMHDFGLMMMNAFDAMREAFDTTPGREGDALNSYVEVYTQQKAELERLAAENQRLQRREVLTEISLLQARLAEAVALLLTWEYIHEGLPSPSEAAETLYRKTKAFRGKSSGEEPAADVTGPKAHCTGLPAAILPMTGEELFTLEYAIWKFQTCRWNDLIAENKDNWNRTAKAISERFNAAPIPQPDPRAALDAEIVRTDHGEHLVILESCGHVVQVIDGAHTDYSPDWAWRAMGPDAGAGADDFMSDKQAAIAAARAWLVEHILARIDAGQHGTGKDN